MIMIAPTTGGDNYHTARQKLNQIWKRRACTLN